MRPCPIHSLQCVRILLWVARVQIHTYSSSRTPKDPAASYVEDLTTAQERGELKTRETWFGQEHAETKHFLVMAAAV